MERRRAEQEATEKEKLRQDAVKARREAMEISIGAPVQGTNGKLGDVDRVIVDARTNNVTDLVVKHGFLFTRDTRIPMEQVAGIRDDKVVLTLTKGEVQRAEESQSQSAE